MTAGKQTKINTKIHWRRRGRGRGKKEKRKKIEKENDDDNDKEKTYKCHVSIIKVLKHIVARELVIPRQYRFIGTIIFMSSLEVSVTHDDAAMLQGKAQYCLRYTRVKCDSVGQRKL